MTSEAHVPTLEDEVSPVHEDGNFSDQILRGPDFDFPRSLCQLDGPPTVKKKKIPLLQHNLGVIHQIRHWIN